MRVVFDTNIWISYLIGKTLKELDDVILNKKITILFSDELLDEFITVLRRPKFHKYFSEEQIQELISILSLRIESIEINQKFNDCRDKKDNFLLDLCVSGRADYLITGDNDLLELNPFHGTHIIDIKSFQKLIK